LVDDVITVDDREIAAAVKWLFDNARLVAEPSGAASVAALLRDRPSAGSGQWAVGSRATADYRPPTNVVAVISGGNVPPEDYARYITGSSIQQ
jgi:threonine dehydratase